MIVIIISMFSQVWLKINHKSLEVEINWVKKTAAKALTAGNEIAKHCVVTLDCQWCCQKITQHFCSILQLLQLSCTVHC